MGICQSSALKVVVFDPESRKHVYYFSLKQMRTFSTIKDVLSLVDVELHSSDVLYVQTPIGIEELLPQSQFQIQNIVIKSGPRVMRYRIFMERLY